MLLVWRELGKKAFAGIELDEAGTFGLNVAKADWKQRYKHFKFEASKFRHPFASAEITNIENDDEVAYFGWGFRVDQLGEHPGQGIYLEVEVTANSDNLSISIVDEDREVGEPTPGWKNISFSCFDLFLE